MDKIAFMIGETFLYWQSLILIVACAVAVFLFLALYLGKGGSAVAASLAVPVSIGLSLVLSRLLHWYCQSASYPSFLAALTDWSSGSFALAGVFAGCLITACILRLLKLERNLPRLLDCMALAGAAAIAVGRLSFLYNPGDRGMILEGITSLPLAYPVVNTVTGVTEYRLATFMLQSILTGVLALALLAYLLVSRLRKKPARDGDLCLIFLLCYGSLQAICDSTRYDSLFLRSNGFVSIVQILGLCAIILVLVLFSIRMVKSRGLRPWQFAIWVGMAGMLGLAGYMEYYVQRHGDRALPTYCVMAASLSIVILLGLLARHLSLGKRRR